MAQKDINYENNIDLGLNQIKNVVVEVVETAPTTGGKAGRIVSYAGDLYVDNGTTFVKLGGAGDVTALATRVTTIENNYATKVSPTGSGLKVTVNSQGLVTAMATLGVSDVDGLSTDLAGKVDKVEGKGLSTEDFTTALKTKLEGVATGAEVNVIDTVKVNGTALTVTSKAVDVTVPTKTSDITNDSGFITKAVDDLTNYYDKDAIDGKISGAFHYKGTVANYSDLPTSNVAVGDVYNITNADTTHGVKAGDNVACSATTPSITWDVLSGVVDLSDYYNKTQVDTELAKKVDQVTGYGLSQNDLSYSLKATYDGYATTIAGKVDANTAITAGTACKITYDAKGLVTAGAGLDASDIPTLAQSKITNLTTDLGNKIPKIASATGSKLVVSVDDGTVAESADLTTKLSGIASGAQVNVIETVKVNGTALTPSSKAVDITVPTNNNQLTNGAGYQTSSDVSSAITTALGSYYSKTDVDGFFGEKSITTAGSAGAGYTATVNAPTGYVPMMAQVMTATGDLVMASVTIGSSSVTVSTNNEFTGKIRILFAKTIATLS